MVSHIAVMRTFYTIVDIDPSVVRANRLSETHHVCDVWLLLRLTQSSVEGCCWCWYRLPCSAVRWLAVPGWPEFTESSMTLLWAERRTNKHYKHSHTSDGRQQNWEQFIALYRVWLSDSVVRALSCSPRLVSVLLCSQKCYHQGQSHHDLVLSSDVVPGHITT